MVFIIVWINWWVFIPAGTASTRIWPSDHITGITLIDIITTINNVNDGSIYFNHVFMISPVRWSLLGINLFNTPVKSTIDDSRRTAWSKTKKQYY